MKHFGQIIGIIAALALCSISAGAASTDFEDVVTINGSSYPDALLTVVNSNTTTSAVAGYFEGGTSGAVIGVMSPVISSDNNAYGFYSEQYFVADWIDFADGSGCANPSANNGRLYYQNSDKTLHFLDSTGTDTDLTAGGGGGGMTSFTLAGDAGGGQAITNGNTASILGGTNGIDTVDSATDKATINLDTTEIDAATFSAGGAASRTWTWNNSGSVDPTLTFGDGLISTNGDLGLPTGGNILVNAAAPRRSIMLRAYDMWASTTQGATGATKAESTTNKQNTQYFAFAGNSLLPQYIEFQTPMPDNWDGGTVYAIFYWSTGFTSTNGVRWGCQGRSYGDGETIDQAWGTAQEVTDNGTGTVNQMLISAETAAITLAGTPAAGEMVYFRIYRDATHAADTNTSQADLQAVKIEYTVQDYGE